MLPPLGRIADITTVSPAVKLFGERVIVQVDAPFELIEQLPNDVAPFFRSVNVLVLPFEFDELSVTMMLDNVPVTFTVFWLPPVAVATLARNARERCVLRHSDDARGGSTGEVRAPD